MLTAVLVGGALSLVVSLAAGAAPGPWNFVYTGAPQTFTVPPEVEKLSMIVVGGAGGVSPSNLGRGRRWRFSKNLGIRRKVSNQQVWFQSDSRRSALPRDSR